MGEYVAVLLLPPSRLPIDRWLKQSVHCAAVSLGVFALGMLVFFFAYPWKSEGFRSEAQRASSMGGQVVFPHEAIGSGALALRPRHALGWISRLSDELALIAYNSRPDISSADAKILMALKNGKEQLTLSSGGALYLRESEQGRGLHASEEATGLWVKPILLESGAVLVEAGRKLVSQEGGAGEEVGQFLVAQQGGIPARYNPTQLQCVKELKGARGFSQDLLIQKYGGREFASWSDKVVLEMAGEGGVYALFVAAGDYLQYDGGQWHILALEELKKESPVAHIKVASRMGCEIQAWDETGFYPVPIKIEMQKPGQIQMKPDSMPSVARLRSASQISCALGKRRVIIRQGDWLLNTPTGWRNLRRSEEIEHYLHHRLKGELLIFDGIEKEQGRSVMKGHLFDVTRTHVQPFAIPIDIPKKAPKGEKRAT